MLSAVRLVAATDTHQQGGDGGPAHPATPQVLVTLGVDTHADSHVAAALDQAGRPRGTLTISATPGG